ncbi:MAG: ATP-dependent 6-phosphofructokinase [Anaerolineaceae bacterium]|nr:ATP-dependent 6-phosphofructokinase [Anaerolineaceae bacterium]
MAPSRIGILTAGSDCPGINAAIRAFGKAAYSDFNMHLIGFADGFDGLVQDRPIEIEQASLSNILTSGGTILGASRLQPGQFAVGQTGDRLQAALATYQRHNLDALVCLGGGETLANTYHLMQHGLNVVFLPKSADNSVPGTDNSIGFNTALEVATEAIDRLHSTAHSHHRIMIVELIGLEAGWLTLGAGQAGGADVILLPEIPYDINTVAEAILSRNEAGKQFSIIAVSEGARTRESVQFFEQVRKVNADLRNGEERDTVAATLNRIENRAVGSTLLLANRLEHLTHLETRTSILGYLLRGGVPSAGDRILATKLGTACAEHVANEQYGIALGSRCGVIESSPLSELINKVNTLPLDHPWITSARRVGVCFGDDNHSTK